MRIFNKTFCGAVALLLSGSLICAPAQAQFGRDKRADFIQSLNEQNISVFLQEVSAISTGQRPDMMDEDVANYFTNHIADNAHFSSNVKFDIPGFPAKDQQMKLNKEEYMASVIQSRYMMEDYNSEIEIKDLKIGGGGKNATFTSVIKERGKMPFPKDPQKPQELELIPVEGVSTCEQRLEISFNNFIQMASAKCDTDIDFDPFGDKPLIPD